MSDPTHGPSLFPALALLSVALIAAADAQDAAREGGVRHHLGSDWSVVARRALADGQHLDLRRVTAAGLVERRTVDPAGQSVALDGLLADERARQHLARGKRTPLLADSFSQLAPDEKRTVAFWLHAPDRDETGRWVRAMAASQSGDQVGPVLRAARTAAQELEALRHAPARQRAEAAVLAAGATLIEVPPEWPFVIARANDAAVDAVAALDEVESVYLLSDTWSEEGGFAQGTMRSHPLFDLGVAANGSVRVLVNDTAQVQLNNVYLPPIVALNSSSAASHATGVAGNIANQHPEHRALAAGLPVLYSAGGSGDSAAPAIWSNAIGEGIDMGNCSWWNFQSGSIQFLDRFFDHTIRTYSVMLFKSNGNQGSTSQPYATTPGNGYNMVSVGAYSDNDTTAWADDTMASTSSWWNPIEGHDKPEVASPGTCVTSTGTGSSGLQNCFGGTSSASPLVAGLGALLLSVDNTLLGEMTTLKAALMASAWHNVEGDALLSERDGAGSVHAAAAYQLVANERWWHGEVTAAQFAGGFLDVPIPAVAGQEVRVCALWQSRANASYTSDVLEMDLDLVVLDPSGTPIATSASAFNPFELTSFDAALSGTYTARLTLQRFDGTSEPLTVAWSPRNDTGHAEVAYAPGTPDIRVGSRPIFRFRDRYTGAGRPFQGVASTTLAPSGTPVLGGGYVLPVGFDSFAAYSAALPGFGGTLNAAGGSRASLLIPNDPLLAGVGLHLAMVVFTTGGAVETVSPPASFTIAP
ncbi:MAG: S8 family serine peptidase [Planctomycetaceae bacterium]|nr:S8 family serine peptidase [Planctomycetaceae bacterium]